MKPRAPALLAFAAALGLHAGLLFALSHPQEARIEGAETKLEAQLGNSFADVAQVAAAAPATRLSAAPAPAARIAPAQASVPAPVVPRSAAPLSPVALPAASPTPQVPAEMLSSSPARPKPRPALKPVPDTAPEAKAQTKAVNAPPKKAAKKGSSTGKKTGKSEAASSGAKTSSKPAGNAKVSDYKGRVMRHLARRVRFGNQGKGVAQIHFTVDGRGRVSSASIAKSSGSSSLDKKALSAVRRAAPFPRPPGGSAIRFSVPIAVR